MTSPNPLLVAPEHENAEPPDNVEGGGVFDSLSDAAAPLFGADRDPGGVTADVASVGVELMGVGMRPLDALAGAGVGWLIEHVEFLHEPLDWLAGDPTVISAQAHTWHNVSTELGAIAGDYERATGRLQGWDGAAMQSYRNAAASYTQALRAGSAHAASVSESISTAGVLVGTTRALIRDLIAELVGDLILRGLVALATAVETAGASVAAFQVSAVASAARLASTISIKIARLVEALGRSAARLRAAAGRADRLAAAMGNARRALQDKPAVQVAVDIPGRGSGPVADGFHNLEWPARALADGSKQDADARQDQRAWRGGEPHTLTA